MIQLQPFVLEMTQKNHAKTNISLILLTMDHLEFNLTDFLDLLWLAPCLLAMDKRTQLIAPSLDFRLEGRNGASFSPHSAARFLEILVTCLNDIVWSPKGDFNL